MKLSAFQVVLFGAFGLAAFVGLFVFATHTNNAANKNNTVGTVVIWGTLSGTAMQNALTEMRKNEPLLKDVSYVQKNEATLPSDLASAIATGTGPDLVLASQEDLEALAKLITPVPYTTLSAAAFSSSFIGEGMLFTAPDNAGYYGLPFLVDPLVLYANRALLSSNGIAKPPATWEALTGLVPNVAQFTPGRQVTRGLIALGTYANVRNARAILSSLFLQAGVPISGYANGTLSANLSGAGASGNVPGQAVLTFYTQFADPSKVSYTWNTSMTDSRQAFLAGDLALYIGYASEAGFLSSANPNLDFTVSPLPQPATATTKSAYGLLYALMIPRGAKNAAGAYQAAALLANVPEQTIAATVVGLAPASLNALTNAPSDPITAVAAAEALYTYGWLSPLPADTDQVFSDMITNVISGRLNVPSALTAGADALTALLQK